MSPSSCGGVAVDFIVVQVSTPARNGSIGTVGGVAISSLSNVSALIIPGLRESTLDGGVIHMTIVSVSLSVSSLA